MSPDADVRTEDPGLGIQDPQVTALLDRLRLILCDDEQVDAHKQLMRQPSSEAQSLLDILQKILDLSGLESSFHRSILLAIQRISTRSGLYPACYELNDVVASDEYPVDFGGFADIFRGMYKDQKVCLKALRLRRDAEATNKRVLKELAKEALLWGQLSHPNVLTFYGLFRFQNRICMVSPWMENGNLSVYLSEHPNVPRLPLAADVANGLSYLHDRGIVHGDLKGKNVLIDSTGHASLADFGIASASDSEIVAWTTQTACGGKGGTTPYQAPELYPVMEDEENEISVQRNTMASDIYAWACVCFEIFMGKPPFHGINPAFLPLKLSKGHRPQCPPPISKPWTEWGLTDDIWTWIERCWHQNYEDRPSAAEVTQYLSLLLPPDARQKPETTPILPAQFRGRMSQGLKAIDVETMGRILFSVDLELEPSTDDSCLIDGDEAMELTTSPTDINEGLATNITRPPSFRPLRTSLSRPPNREASAEVVHDGTREDQVILIIGPSGAGKTSFVDDLFGNYVGLQDHLNTNYIQYYHGTFQDRRICIVDTPGFRGDSVVDNEILKQISNWLSQSYPAGMVLAGIIYLQDITRITVTERMKTNLRSLWKLHCFDAAVPIIFVTTMWSKVSQKVGEHCESRLRRKYWKDLFTSGFTMCRFDGTQNSTLAILETALSHRAPESSFEFVSFALKAIRGLFAANVNNRRIRYADDLPISKKRGRAYAPSLLPQPLKAGQGIEIENGDIIIAIMGTVGQESKLSFIDDALGGGYDRVDIISEGVHLFVMCSPIDATRNIFLVYTTRVKKLTDSLRTITKWLSALCGDKRKLSGLIYLEDLTSARLPQISQKDLILLKKCIECQNIVVTTMGWTDGIDTQDMEERHTEVIHRWKSFVDQGANVVQLAASKEAFRDVSHTPWDAFMHIITRANDTIAPAAAGEHTSNELANQFVTVDRRSEHQEPQLEGPALALLVSKVTLVLHTDDAYRRLLKSSDPQTVLDTLQKLLDLPILDARLRRSILAAIEKIGATSRLWPAFHKLENVGLDGEYPVTFGEFAEIFKGSCHGQIVAIKSIRIYHRSMETPYSRTIAREALLWGQLIHPNILAFYGVFRFRNQIGMVSPWMDNGDIKMYLLKHPSVSRLALAVDVANGLSYLHDFGIVHGGLMSINVLVDAAGQARLSDFSLSSAAHSNIFSSTCHLRRLSREGSSRFRWMARELLEEPGDSYEMRFNTTATDVHAWGCVCFEIFTGDYPFADIKNIFLLIDLIMRGDCPKRPPASSRPWAEWGLTEHIWSWMEHCWHQDPKKRPSAAQIVEFLTPLLPASDTRKPTTGEMLPKKFRHSMGGGLKADDFKAFNRVLSTAGIEFTAKAPNQVALKLRHIGGGDDPDAMSISEGKEKKSDKLQLEDFMETDIVIVVIGPTSSGKSTFISYLAGQLVAGTEHRNRSTTTQLQHVIVPHPTDQTRRIVLVDTPGFDDSYAPDSQILERVAKWIEQSYNTTTKFAGIIYLHAMSQPRMLGTAQRSLGLLDKLMSGSATKNIVLATTKWGDVSAEVGASREERLTDRYWKWLIEHGAKLHRFNDSQESAWTVIQSILGPDHGEQLQGTVHPENRDRSWLKHALWFSLALGSVTSPYCFQPVLQFLGRRFIALVIDLYVLCGIQ